jgi:RimJ/RimL family protein N-acetyltransferase
MMALWNFFKEIKDDKFFQPHPFTYRYAFKLCNSDSDDEYYLLNNFEQSVAYGFVRGWDEDWKDKCLGVIAHPKHRRKGYGYVMVNFLCGKAKERGLKQLRLHCNPDNIAAMKLYKKCGFIHYGEYRENGELIMWKQFDGVG